MSLTFYPITKELYDYAVCHRTYASDPLMQKLRSETMALGEISEMAIPPEEESFLSILVAACNAKTAIEVGTFTGIGSIAIARAFPQYGKLVGCEINPQWIALAYKCWKEAGLEHKIEAKLGPALKTIQELEEEVRFDFAFIDADKENYENYYELLLPKMRQNGLLDNMFWRGRVLCSEKSDKDALVLNRLNDKLSNDTRIESVLLPIADGVVIARKKS
ncbi:SAM-dependent methyltransferase [Methylacidiphilum kamchatkense Kam1]|uniref:Caffeoyl-CoA O-methyltransferase n=1 Tax=Methylacidiphilum kamchatkense Kam1 TaxID=1202785 RepID=A0A0C1UT21_9BACT|nr:class I SAM-dependent methyltransferase [Methylacidiphilum kamchatkense]KIE58953.1 SAM-dependent methyltransferase [Methylacidiphilum kamchatkense Kam1]QDQ43165.1 caffeoyl-CoA O-methyltransferase [Methylacidiphilum kamchatkense Kam1]